MNVEIGTEAAQFPEKEYINGVFVAVWTASRYLSWVFVQEYTGRGQNNIAPIVYTFRLIVHPFWPIVHFTTSIKQFYRNRSEI